MMTGHKPQIPITFHLNLVRDQDSRCINEEFCKDLLPHSHYKNDCQNEKFRTHSKNAIFREILNQENATLRVHSTIYKIQQE